MKRIPKRLAKAPSSGHRNEKRRASAIALRTAQGLQLAKTDRIGAHAHFVKGLVIELMCSDNSQFAKAMKAYANQQSYALRIALPRRSSAAKISVQQPVARHAPPDPPALQAGRVVTWRLDLRSEAHSEALLKYMREVQLPADVMAAHLHSAPPCTWVSKGQTINFAKGYSLVPQFRTGATLLALSRKIIEIWRHQQVGEGVAITASHEQSARSTLAVPFKVLSKRELLGIGPGYPWGISESCAKNSSTIVNGTAVGLMSDGLLVNKKWRIETDNDLLLQVLKSFSKKGTKKCIGVWGERNRPGAGARSTEKYPKFLAHLMCAAICLDKRCIELVS